MHLDDGRVEGGERVADRHGSVGEGGRVDDDAGGAFARGVDEVDDLIFPVALMELDRKLEFRADASAVGLDVGQCLASVNVRLALAQQVEIWAVEDADDWAHASDSPKAAAAPDAKGAARCDSREVSSAS